MAITSLPKECKQEGGVSMPPLPNHRKHGVSHPGTAKAGEGKGDGRGRDLSQRSQPFEGCRREEGVFTSLFKQRS